MKFVSNTNDNFQNHFSTMFKRVKHCNSVQRCLNLIASCGESLVYNQYKHLFSRAQSPESGEELVVMRVVGTDGNPGRGVERVIRICLGTCVPLLTKLILNTLEGSPKGLCFH